MATTFRAIVVTGTLALATMTTVATAQDRSSTARAVSRTMPTTPHVIEVTNGVHVAIGFGLANSILIEGDDGVVVVDTMESGRAARAVKAEFDKISTKPVRAIVYTHNHYDHVMGAKIFAGNDAPEVYAHASTMAEVHRNQVLREAMLPRNIRQFGITLPQRLHEGAGIGPRLSIDEQGAPVQFLPPTQVIHDEPLLLDVAGIEMELVHAPGETPDQLYVWLPDKRTLLPGDNYYEAFPNLYAIRGTPYRDPLEWVESLDKMIAEEPEVLVPSHTQPIVGRERIREVLTDYRNAIRSVYDQTVAGMNQGLTPDELIEVVRLPEELTGKPYLQETYGTVAWSVRTIYSGLMGWFNGDATQLFPLPGRERARRMIELAGGHDELMERTQSALSDGDYQWAAELAGCLMAVADSPGEAHSLQADAFKALAVRQTSFNARNYYLSTARNLEAAVRKANAD